MFRLKKIGTDKNAKFEKVISQEFQAILEMENFNTEDKLFLNKIAFLIFRRHSTLATYEHFYASCKKLQEGNEVQKLFLLLNLIDEDDSGEI